MAMPAMVTIFNISKKIAKIDFTAMSELPISFKLPADIGPRLRELREARGLSRPVLAKRLTLSDAQLRQIEENETSLFYSESIRIAAARKVADFLGEPHFFQAMVESSPVAQDPKLETSSMAAAILTPDQPEVPSGKAAEASPDNAELIAEAPAQNKAVGPSKVINKTEVLFPEMLAETWRVFPTKPLVRWGTAVLVLLVLLVLVVLADISLWIVGDGKTLFARTAAVHPAQQMPATSLQVTPSTAAQSPSLGLAPVAVTGKEPAFPGVVADSAQADEAACDKFQGPAPTFSPAKATKEASLVYVVGTPGQWVCLKDGRSRAWRHDFASRSGQSFYGHPPWLVESPQLDSLQIYFQGVLVRPSQAGRNRIRLVASEIS
jgi:cytoskeleton protein RodZ